VIGDRTRLTAQFAVETGGKKLWHCSADRIASFVGGGVLHPACGDLPCRSAQQFLGLRVLRRVGCSAEEVEEYGRDGLVDPFVRTDCSTKLSHHRDVTVVKARHRVVVPGGDQL
jgi:hypothetical protein